MNMYFLKGIYRPKSISPFLAVLDEMEYDFLGIAESFKIVKDTIERDIYMRMGEWKSNLIKNGNPRLNICIAISNVAYAHLQTGRYNIYRGEIADFGAGKGLLELYDYANSELVKMKSITKKEASEFRRNLDEEIATVG